MPSPQTRPQLRTEVKTEIAGSPLGYLAGRRWMYLLLPALLALLVHLPALWSELSLDDRYLIVDHPRISEARFIKEIFTRDYGLELGPREKIGYYRPLLMVLDFGLFQVFGPSAIGYHAIVLLTFCISCVLLTELCSRALGESRQGLALFIGCLAAVHPIRTEFAVFFMTMPDLLMEVLSILIIGICLRYFGNFRELFRWILAGSLALAAGLTKETSFYVVGAIGATLVLSGLVSNVHRRRILDGLALFVGLGGAFALRLSEGIGMPSGGAAPNAMVSAGSGRALAGLVEAISNLILPSKAVFWSDDWTLRGGSVAVGAVLILMAVLVVWLVWRGQLFEALISAWLAAGLFILMLLCARDLPFVDRYIPSGAAIIALCLSGSFVWRHIRGRIANWGAVPAIVLVGYLAINAVYAWTSTMKCVDGREFFMALAEDNPKSCYPRLILAYMMFSRYHDLEKSAAYVQEAVALAPDNAKARALGVALAKTLIDASEYQRGLETLAWSGKGLPESAELWSLRAKAEAGLRDFPAAIHSMQRAVALAPERKEFSQQLEEITAAAAK